jgi:hypothetical protein
MCDFKQHHYKVYDESNLNQNSIYTCYTIPEESTYTKYDNDSSCDFKKGLGLMCKISLYFFILYESIKKIQIIVLCAFTYTHGINATYIATHLNTLFNI